MADASSSMSIKRVLIHDNSDYGGFDESSDGPPRFRRRVEDPEPNEYFPVDPALVNSASTIPSWLSFESQTNSSVLYPSQEIFSTDSFTSYETYNGVESLDSETTPNDVSDSQIVMGRTPFSVFSSEPGENAQDTMEFSAPDANINMTSIETPICYGMIFNEKMKVLGEGLELERKVNMIIRDTPDPHSYTFRVVRRSVGQLADQLFLIFTDGSNLGYLTEKWANNFRNIFGKPGVELDAIVDCFALQKILQESSKPSDAAMRVHINIYGPTSERDAIGEELSDKGFFLQRPDHLRPQVEYDNPHVLSLGFDGTTDESDTSTREASVTVVDDLFPSQEEEAETVQDLLTRSSQEEEVEIAQGLLNRSSREQGLRAVEGSQHLRKPLFVHQEKALDFMTQRETGEIPPEYRLWEEKEVDGENWFVHSVTHGKVRERPDESGGGILADEMGMGKSLTTLALIKNTRIQARDWAEGQDASPEELSNKPRTPATLVVVPSLVLINTWLREIETFLGDSVKAARYHGPKRKAILADLGSLDVVITTYNTLTTEHAINKSHLHKFSWYRVVLDEAHFIRRPATTFHRAVVDLAAKSRWCLSGTPIQNSLLDLGALLAFIQVKPFHHLSAFRHWIATPFKERGRRVTVVKKLTRILDALCLRRTIDKLNVPGKTEEFRLVEFSEQEQRQYDETKAAMRRSIQHQVAQYNRRNNMIGMFQVFLQLRVLCNLGTYRYPFAWTKPVYLDEEEDAVCSLTRTNLRHCSACRQTLPIVTRDKGPRYVEKCMHDLCDECAGDETSAERSCPLCTAIGPPLFPAPLVQPHPASDPHTTLKKPGGTHLGNDGYFNTKGFSSKMQHLISDVERDVEKTQSIIFSCWRRTLDLIAEHLEQVNIKFFRIDSTTPSAKRQKILDKFDSLKEVPVLIMTTGTGAFGLNLPSVNRVFIVEPQWNPSVERQAIARAIRLNQTEQVRVIRYHIKNSIEENMIAQQKEKLRIGKMDPEELLGPLPTNSQASSAEEEFYQQTASSRGSSMGEESEGETPELLLPVDS